MANDDTSQVPFLPDVNSMLDMPGAVDDGDPADTIESLRAKTAILEAQLQTRQCELELVEDELNVVGRQRARAEVRIQEYEEDRARLQRDLEQSNANYKLMFEVHTQVLQSTNKAYNSELRRRKREHDEISQDHRSLMMSYMQLEDSVSQEPTRKRTKVDKCKEATGGLSVHEMLERKSECAVCMDTKHLSVMLPCFHSCCQTCASRTASATGLKCPICRRRVQFTHNFKAQSTFDWTGPYPRIVI